MTHKFKRNDLCWCGSGQKYKKCHDPIEKQIELYRFKGYEVPHQSLLKTKHQIDGIRDSGKRNIEILDFIGDYIKDGTSTEELDRLIFEKTRELGGVPATLNYDGYPKSVCISINDVACHGIPSDRIYLKDGDIVNVDVSTIYNGYFSDSSRMFCVGEVSDKKKKLVDVAKECVDLGVEQIKPWGFLGDIGYSISNHARANGYSVVGEIGGHGIGLEFHEEPWVSYVAKQGTGLLLVPGLIFTIEPMINMGRPNVVTDQIDHWTVRTADGMPSAQWEKTILVTETGYEVLAY